MSYEHQWQEYKKRRNLFWIIWLTYLPGVLIIGYPLGKFFRSETPFIILAVVWMVFFIIAGTRFSYWKCPRCGNSYFAKWWYANQFVRKCVHCKLPKWANEDPDKPEIINQ
ncbi:MAG: hypothetical protein PHV60_05075 [bacterium]|nr:hypothetical protein [bacterium]